MDLLYWLVTNCALSLLPVPLVALGLWAVGERVHVAQIIRDGQLFFYTASLVALAIADVLKSATNLGALKGIPLSLTVLCLAICIMLSSFMLAVSVMAHKNDRAVTLRLAWMSTVFAAAVTAVIGAIRQSYGIWG